MADLFNQQISATYSGLLKTSSSGVLSASLSQISDGRGNTSPLYLSTDSIQFYGAYSFPNADGSANQVLKTDGAGVLTWEDDSLSNTLNFSGGTGTGSVTLDTQTLAFTGTANEIETSASSQAITLSFPTAGVTLPDGSVATTQSPSDDSTKVATTEYVEAAVAAGGGGDVTKIDPITANQIAVWNDSTDELRSDAAISIATDGTITLYQPNSDDPIVVTNSYNIGGGNIATTTGYGNTGFGGANLSSVTSGGLNVAMGLQTMLAITTGTSNTALGTESMRAATSSTANVSIGYKAGLDLTTGSRNVLVGQVSGSSLTGNVASTQANDNTFLGFSSGSAMTTGSYNVIIGGFTGTTGEVPTPVYDIRTSSNNIVLSDGDGNVRQSFDSNGKVFIESQYAGGRLNVKASGTNPYEGINVGSSALDSIYAYITHNGTQALIGSSGIENDAAAYTPLSLQTSEVDRLTISTGGTVSIGSSTATNPLSIRTANGESYLRFLNFDGSNYGDLERSITGNGAVRITTPYFRVTGTLETQLIESAIGISFPNQSGGNTRTVASSTLDAYEEGTWTGTMLNSNSVADPTAVGTYVRVGDLVHCQVFFNAKVINNAGAAYVTGLPFTATSSESLGYGIMNAIHNTATNSDGAYINGTQFINSTPNATSGSSWIIGTKSAMWAGTYKIN